ncbi:RING finger and transmembrane domain-containing protein 2-like [Eriocheir sinensis]|uniref:RING finger and transmembrane domain-containing protein 2-like n=1 Tax=Eriocheir sinensis TaxID=95602 RepID=UPI0021C932E6|nr:RING finger and transmembrane domain-containing protein 2-like [Eriocheir sinensis]XP_050693481.1 RING finger and transmembrane domain-containing protein 2-like [Eriocheir sinensis]XP_050693482.1 RING finger and transmembrane domain-containing protein 2-like [Eriocheir sinensis]XP_050693483.1 RING finger and transmembrane domain-containing protein 2-like [Eriocheir sinensis]XP_050693484.1 RING finger and transmembrane domain-containing protein 2-like [Eriocheir sinensis]XP_050693485.1 RING 
MAGHGRPIVNPEEAARSRRIALPVSLTSRLQTNTWRQVFTSLRPLVAHTRQRTLNTYARRLHHRQLTHQSRRGRPEEQSFPDEREESPVWSGWPSLFGSQPQQQHPEGSAGQRQAEASQNVVIDIEAGGSPDRSLPSTIDLSNSEQFTHTIDGEGPGGMRTREPPDHLDNTPSQLEPLLPTAASGVTAVAGENGNTSDAANEDNANNRSASESLTELLSQFPEVRSGLLVAWNYCIFLFILLAKAVFDHLTGLMVILTLVIGFLWSNNIVKKAVSQQGRRPIKPLLALLVNLPAGVFLLYYSYRTDKLFYSALLIPPEHEGFGVLDLMWIVIVSDYVLKLATVLVKTVITLMPHSFMHYQNRGKYFLVVEMGSQLYRCLAPIQPWLSYLLDGYTGPPKVLGVFFSAAYMVCKGPDIVTKMKCFQGAIVKFVNSVNYGCTPSKAQLDDAGGLCPICHDDFYSPTMLRCKHIFCEQCVVTWFDRERTCPMCRTQVADDPAWRDGSTTNFLQLY